MKQFVPYDTVVVDGIGNTFTFRPSPSGLALRGVTWKGDAEPQNAQALIEAAARIAGEPQDGCFGYSLDAPEDRLPPEAQAAYDAAFQTAVLAERARIRSILELPEAAGRERQALAVALDPTGASPEFAAKLLAATTPAAQTIGQQYRRG